MLKKKTMMTLIFPLFFLCFIDRTAADLEIIELQTLYLTAPIGSDLPIAIRVPNQKLKEISSSVLLAEQWLRTQVLAHYPSTKITTIVIGTSSLSLCNNNKNQEQIKLSSLLLPSLKNIFYSLTRWGLQRDIKVSSFFTLSESDDDCFENNHLPSNVVDFLKNVDSTITLNHPPQKSVIKKKDFFNLNTINIMSFPQNERNPVARKLSFEKSQLLTPFPEIPQSEQSPSPSPVSNHSPYYYYSSPPLSFPVMGPTLPPCNPAVPAGAPGPQLGGPLQQQLWCVAKPTVPAEQLQEAMDYACGEGGADCEEIMVNGNCYEPDTVVAHASYAFNSYWQKYKRSGGICSFGGTAMIINSDPSFLHCQFVLS